MPKICFMLQGQTICLEIPTLIRRWRVGPEPDPVVVVDKPEPEPWLTDARIPQEQAAMLSKMATVAQVARLMGPAISAPVQRALGAQVRQMNLPEGVSVRF